ncbi:hypothetical protein CPC08DRAFT_769098 [Agrocybe pediades]|nr:hypothetical protein CPC08DRAFT_769098 [Agrocybe pediades]
MGRRRLYFTDEEKRAANKASSKRYRDKYKDDINTLRREAYQLRKAAKNPTSSQENSTSSPDNVFRSDLDVWLERVELIHGRFNRYLSHQPASHFMDSVCLQFIKDKDPASIQNSISILEDYQNSLYDYQDRILNLDGVQNAFTQCASVINKIKTLILWLEEVHLMALCEDYKVEETYYSNGFEYQKECGGNKYQ